MGKKRKTAKAYIFPLTNHIPAIRGYCAAGGLPDHASVFLCLSVPFCGYSLFSIPPPAQECIQDANLKIHVEAEPGLVLGSAAWHADWKGLGRN